MKNNNYVLIEQSNEEILEKNPINKIALIAHNCYQVKEKDYDDNYAFLKRLINNKHFAMLEHYQFVMRVKSKKFLKDLINLNNRFILITEDIISYSIRTPMELCLSEDKNKVNIGEILLSSVDDDVLTMTNEALNLNIKKSNKYLEKVDPTTLPLQQRKVHLFLSFALVTNRGVTHEIVRHRLCAFAQESTRYCNYTKNKFSNQLTFIKPVDYLTHKKIYDDYFQHETDAYFSLINEGATPDLARSVLCNALKARIIVTCSIEEWEHIFELRCSNFAHQDIRELLLKVKDKVEKYLK